VSKTFSEYSQIKDIQAIAISAIDPNKIWVGDSSGNLFFIDKEYTNLLNHKLLNYHKSSITQVLLSQNQRILYTASQDGCFKALDITQTLATPNNPHAISKNIFSEGISSMLVTHDSKSIIFGQRFSGGLQKLDLSNMQITLTKKFAHNDTINALTLTADDQTLFTCCNQGNLKKINTKSFEIIKDFGCLVNGPIECLQITGAG
jgi:WD40 repeat protein